MLYAPEVYVHHHRGDTMKIMYKKCASYGKGRADNIFINAKGVFFYGGFIAVALVYLIALLLHYRHWPYWTPIILYFFSCAVMSVIHGILIRKKNVIKSISLLFIMFVCVHVSYAIGLLKEMARNLIGLSFDMKTLRLK